MTTVNLVVAASEDDARETAANTSFNSTFGALYARSATSASSQWHAGVRFQSVAIAQGDTIDTTDLQVLIYSTGGDDANVDIYCEDVDDAANFTTTADVTDRTVTTESVGWVADALGTGYVSAPSILLPVQEVINRGSWASGNAMVVLLKGRSDTWKSLDFRSYDNSGGANKATLDIDFTGGGGGGGVMVSRRLLSGHGA